MNDFSHIHVGHQVFENPAVVKKNIQRGGSVKDPEPIPPVLGIHHVLPDLVLLVSNEEISFFKEIPVFPGPGEYEVHGKDQKYY